MTAYYNEIDPYAAQWLRNLISPATLRQAMSMKETSAMFIPTTFDATANVISSPGSASEPRPAARRLADDRPVWTGSCPCPPFSAAGKDNSVLLAAAT